MRVLVTRPQADGERTAQRLAAHGHDPVIAPVLRIERTGEQAPGGAFDAIILTSANAVPCLASLTIPHQDIRIFAVGERTASAAVEAGLSHVQAAGGDADSLAELVARTLQRDAKLLHVTGRNRKREPEASLAAAGFAVTTWIAYAAVAADRLPEGTQLSLSEDALDSALHYSRRSAGILLHLAREAGLTRPFLALRHVCLSSDVAVPLQEAGAQHLSIAARPDEEALLAALDQCVEKSGSAGSRMPHSEW